MPARLRRPVAAPMSASAPVAATQVPANQAPVIVSFFASAPSPEERAQGVAYFLNYDTRECHAR